MYNESLGRWRTADLLIGLAYLARQESANRAIADIACTGRLVGEGVAEGGRQQLVVRFLARSVVTARHRGNTAVDKEQAKLC